MKEKKKFHVKLQDVWNVIEIMIKKLDKLDMIDERIKMMDQEIKKVKKSIEYAHAEVQGRNRKDGKTFRNTRN